MFEGNFGICCWVEGSCVIEICCLVEVCIDDVWVRLVVDWFVDDRGLYLRCLYVRIGIALDWERFCVLIWLVVMVGIDMCVLVYGMFVCMYSFLKSFENDMREYYLC